MDKCNWYNPACALEWIGEELRAFGLWLWEAILNGLSTLMGWIPVPDFMVNMTPFQMPEGIAYFAAGFQIPAGIGIIVTAYIARFLIRRIPFIG